MTEVWQELRHFLKRSYRNQQATRKFELRERLEQVLFMDQTNHYGHGRSMYSGGFTH